MIKDVEAFISRRSGAFEITTRSININLNVF